MYETQSEIIWEFSSVQMLAGSSRSETRCERFVLKRFPLLQQPRPFGFLAYFWIHSGKQLCSEKSHWFNPFIHMT